ncbi:MAG: hypothetical protein HKN23_09670 [Verrucomicrobiales bacterium]|nr:hypothetical protein [Verrucomicrobiales bacterium]
MKSAFSIGISLAISTTSAIAIEPSYEREPVLYSDTDPNTPLTRIADRIEKGEMILQGQSDREILVELLELLEIHLESQLLVFSKTSAQNSRISPRTPRVIYFSDNAYLGWVQGGNIEAMTFDENLGAVFHMIHLTDREPGRPPVIARERSCLNCHGGSATGNFPGGLVRSVFPSETGLPIFHAGTFRTTDASPLEERWGGWYVTGRSGKMGHMGNMIAKEVDRESRDVVVEKIHAEPVRDLQEHFDCTPYPAGGVSDIVALMIFEHQIKVHNALVQGNLTARQTLHRHKQMRKAFNEPRDAPLSETNRGILENQASKIVRALLFVDEFEMKNDGVDGSINFQKAFVEHARKDAEFRSLRDLRLYERLFKYRCSYLIYSDAFLHLPDELKSLVFKQLRGILTDAPSWPDYDYLSASERRRILQILEETHPNWPKAENE